MRLVIIGNGITGLTAARTVRKRLPKAQIQIISGEHDYPFSRTALMYVYMGHLTFQATECYDRGFYGKNSLELIRDTALQVDPAGRRVALQSGRSLEYDALLIATGSKPAKYGWPGENLEGVQGLYSLADLESLELISRKGIGTAVVVGGGLIGIELAEMLHSRGIPVTFLVRESSYAPHILPPAESEMVNQEIRRHGIDLRLGAGLKEIRGRNNRATSVLTDGGEEIACDFVGLTAGVTPNVELAKASSLECGRGVLVSDRFQTNFPGVFAAGDCAQFKTPDGHPGRVEQLWYTGRMQGARVGGVIADALEGRESSETYRPDVFFNSAKFFTIEYQTYGTVPPEAASVFAIDEPRSRSIRIAFSTEERDARVLGFVLMGIRYRHEVCERWIKEERSIDYVIDHIGEANFDPEFSMECDSVVKAAYERRKVVV